MEDGTLFTHQSEHASIQIRADDLAIRVNHGKIHQLAMRDPTDQFDLPDHIAYQMNIAFERINVGDYPQVTKSPAFTEPGREYRLFAVEVRTTGCIDTLVWY